MGQFLLGLKFTVSTLTFIIFLTGYYCILKYTENKKEEKAFAQLLVVSAFLDFLGVVFNIPYFYNEILFYPLKLFASFLFIAKLLEYYFLVGTPIWFTTKKQKFANEFLYLVLSLYAAVYILHYYSILPYSKVILEVFNAFLIGISMFYFLMLIFMMTSLLSILNKVSHSHASESLSINVKWVRLNTLLLYILALCYPVYMIDRVGWIQLIVQIFVLIIFMFLINQNLFRGTYKDLILFSLKLEKKKGLIWEYSESKFDIEVVRESIDYQSYFYLLEQFESQYAFADPDCSLDFMYNFFDKKYDKRFLSELIYQKEQIYFLSYLQRLRIYYAVEMIDSTRDLSLKEIAFKTGFGSQAAFSRSFSSVMGISPSEFRQKNAI